MRTLPKVRHPTRRIDAHSSLTLCTCRAPFRCASQITLKEFATGLQAVGVHCDMQEYRRLFDAVDLSGDHRVDLIELRSLLWGKPGEWQRRLQREEKRIAAAERKRQQVEDHPGRPVKSGL